MSETVRTQIRLPAELHAAVKAETVRTGESLNAALCRLVSERLAGGPSVTPKAVSAARKHLERALAVLGEMR